MFAENDKIFDPDYIGLLIHICFFYVTEDFDFNKGLFGETGLVFDDLESYLFFGLVVKGFEHLSVRSFADN